MHRNITSAVLAFSVLASKAQDHQENGWHIIEPGAKYAVVSMSSADLSYWMNNTEGLQQMANANTLEANLRAYQENLTMNSGEVVFVTDHFKDKYIAFDPMGRMVAFQGEGQLTAAPLLPGAGVGHIEEDIQLISGDVVKRGSFVWVIGQDLAKSTVTVQLASGVKLDIPQSKITLVAAQERRKVNEMKFKPVD